METHFLNIQKIIFTANNNFACKCKSDSDHFAVIHLVSGYTLKCGMEFNGCRHYYKFHVEIDDDRHFRKKEQIHENCVLSHPIIYLSLICTNVFLGIAQYPTADLIRKSENCLENKERRTKNKE